jgi:predicted Zn finger-like uncharacterized protein
MQVICPTCNSVYRIPSDRIPVRKTLATCKRCGGKITIEPRSEGSQVPSAETRPSPRADFGSRQEISPSQARGWTSPDLAVLGEYPELESLDPGRFSLAEIFTVNRKGSYKTRVNTLKAKILSATQDVLVRLLQSGERVLRIAKATAYYPAEIFFGNGWLTTLYNHYALVATDQRLLFINVNPKISHPTHYFFQMPYGAIKKVATGLLGTSLVIHRVQGRRRTFTNLKRAMGRELREFVRERQSNPQILKAGSAVVENLCPSCLLPLEKNLLSCPKCRAAFKRPQTALLKSLVLPGWGDVYLGHRVLGLLEMIGSALIWTVALGALVSGHQENFIFAGVLLAFYNGIDGLLTLHMAKKGYMLAK